MGNPTDGVRHSSTGQQLFDPNQSQSSFDWLPDEVIQGIFCKAGMKTTGLLATISRRFFQIANDPSTWRTFCRTFPGFRPYHENEMTDYKRLACQLSYLPTNLAQNHYALESHQYPADACHVHLTQDALFVIRPDFTIEIYNPENHFLTKTIQLRPCSEQILTLGKLVNAVFTRCPQSAYEPYETQVQKWTELVGQIEACVTHPEVSFLFTDFRDHLDSIAEMLKQKGSQPLLITAHVLTLVQRMWNKAIYSSETALADHPSQISCLAASQNYLGIVYKGLAMDLIDLQTGEKQSRLKYGKNKVYLFRQTTFFVSTKSLTISRFEEREPDTIPDILDAKKMDESTLLIIDTTKAVHLLNVETRETELQFQAKGQVIDICYDLEKGTFYYIAKTESLAIHNSVDDRTIPLPSSGTLSFNHGYLWVFGENGSITKVNPNSGEQSILLPPVEEKRVASWFNEKLFVHTYGKGMQVFNFLATPQEIVEGHSLTA